MGFGLPDKFKTHILNDLLQNPVQKLIISQNPLLPSASPGQLFRYIVISLFRYFVISFKKPVLCAHCTYYPSVSQSLSLSVP